MSRSFTETFKNFGLQGALFAILLAIVLMAPKFLFFGTLGYALFTFIIFKISKQKFDFKPFYWVYIAFYLLYAIMLMWTDNLDLGTRDLEFKLMFLTIPLVMAMSAWKEKDLMTLTFGLNIVIFFCLNYAWVTYINCYDPVNGCFSHERNSGNVHPTYMALYSVTTILMSIYHFLFVKYQNWKAIFKWSWFAFLVVGIAANVLYIVMVDSKAGIMGAVIGPGILFLAWIYKKFSRTQFAVLLAGLAIVFSVGMYKILTLPGFKLGITVFSEYLQGREEFLVSNCIKLESNTARIIVWDSSVQVLKAHPFGVGAGDVPDELMKIYKLNDYESVIAKQLNPHSQFFHTSLALGIPGILSLMYMFFYGLVKGVRRKYVLLFIFSFLIIFNALFESILDLQVGIFYFVFFSLIFEQLSRNKAPELEQ